MKRIIVFSTILLSGWIFSQTYSIQLNLKPQENYSFSTVMNMKMIQKITGQEVPIDMDINFGLSMKVLSIENEVYKMETVYDTFIMNINAMGQITRISSHSDANNPLNKMYKNIVNVPFYVYLKPNGEITKIEGFEKLGQKMIEAFPKEQQEIMDEELSKVFSEKNIINNFNQIFFAIPKKPVAIDESWENSYMQKSNEFDFKYNITSQLKAVHDDYYEIDFIGEINTLEGAVLKKLNMEMNIDMQGTSSGKIFLHKDSGWIKNSDNQSKITGKMLMVKPSKMNIDVDIDMKYQSKDGKIDFTQLPPPPKAPTSKKQNYYQE